jgi:hypothetical protein
VTGSGGSQGFPPLPLCIAQQSRRHWRLFGLLHTHQAGAEDIRAPARNAKVPLTVGVLAIGLGSCGR